MNARTTAQITLDVIDVGDRLRGTDRLQVEALAESMKARGLLSPIQVRPADGKGRYRLIAGAHRVAAALLLQAAGEAGWNAIDAVVVDVADEDEARLLEIEENLIRHDLTALDRAVFLAEWKATYDRITNARKPGRPKGLDIPQESADFPLPFSEAVKERLKMSRRSVEIAVRRAGLHQKLRAALVGHPAADSGLLLDALRNLPKEDQAQIADKVTADMSLADLRGLALQARGAPQRREADPMAKFQRIWDAADARLARGIVAYIKKNPKKEDAP